MPYAWRRTCHPKTPDEYDAYESAANGLNKVWECYVVGICPTNEAARFETTITMGTDGKPAISHDPLLRPEEAAKREYRILGKQTLDPTENWNDVTDVPDLDAAGYRFFKATVRMKE